MDKELITKRQALCTIMLFIFGSTVVMGGNSSAEQDSWLSLLLASVAIIPLVLIYARIIRLYPGSDLFAIFETLFGKIVGKVCVALMSWYALHLASLVLRNFSEFIQITSMPETPQLPLMIAMMLVTAYIAKSGIEALGRWSLVVLPVVILVVLFTTVSALPKMDFSNILPIMGHDFGTIAEGSFAIFTFPFAETVLFLGVAGAIKSTDSPYKIYIKAVLAGAAVLLIVVLRNLEILGSATMSTRYFPSYAAARIIEVGDFFSRIEGVISMNFLLTGVVKITLCLLVAAKGIARLFGIDNYRRLVMPVGILVTALCAIVYDNTMQMFSFLPIYEYYALPFQIIIPLVVWIVAEIKAKRKKPKKAVAKA